MPTPVSATWSSTRSPHHSSADADAAFERELERIREQVEDDLLPHVAVHVDRLRQRIALDHERQPGFLDRRSEDAGELGGERREIRGFVAGVDASGLDAREIQQRVDQLQQPLPVPMGDVHVGRGVGRQRLAGRAQDVLQRTDHQRQRRPELVRDVREERRLGAIELGQRFRPAPLFLERLRVGQRRRDLGCDQPEERSIVLVERAHRAHRGNEDRARVFLARQQNGQHHGAVRRHLPCAGRQRAEPRPQLMGDGGLTRAWRLFAATTDRARPRPA